MNNRNDRSIQRVLHEVGQIVEKKFPEDAKFKAIGGFLFLRFIVPAISAPHMYGLYEG